MDRSGALHIARRRSRGAVDVVLIAYGCALGWVCWELPGHVGKGKLLLMMMKPEADVLEGEGDGEGVEGEGAGEGGWKGVDVEKQAGICVVLAIICYVLQQISSIHNLKRSKI